MSIHVKLSPEAQSRLAAQRRNSSIGSGVIALLVVIILGLVMGFFLLPNISKEVPVIVTYASSLEEETKVEEKKVTNKVQRKPSSPSSSMAKVIAANTVANVSIPVPDNVVAVEALDFGDGNDFGTGWGDSDFGSGGGASFFNQSVKANRIAYVIDYSLSMKGEREKLMRKELSKSISGLGGGVKYQMIFFSGPAWVAGSELPGFKYQSGKATVKGKGGHKYEWTGKGLHEWTPRGKWQPVDWQEVTSGNMAQSLKIIKETPLSGGTDWEHPLLMAINADPPPQIVFFMTDGTVGGRDMIKLTNDLAAKAKKRNVVVNTIAMMEPKAEAPMANLAKRTGGQFTVIGKDGKVKGGGRGK
jgi:hypothetical protein